jgi:hypothetical protein
VLILSFQEVGTTYFFVAFEPEPDGATLAAI